LGSCEQTKHNPASQNERGSEASHPEQVRFSGSHSGTGRVYEVLPGPAPLDPSQKLTPFSDKLHFTTGTYSYTVQDNTPDDAVSSTDAVPAVEVRFTGNDGRKYLIDNIKPIHKALGTGEHTYFGGVGLNKVIHGNTGVGTPLEPKLLAYIAFWGTADLKDASTGQVVAADRMVHIMSTTKVRDKNLRMITSATVDSTDHDIHMVETHVILPPMNMKGEKDPIPGTDHGFIHMMFEQVVLDQPSRDPNLVYEVLPGPAALDSTKAPTAFSNRVAYAGGSYRYTVQDLTADDSPESKDEVTNLAVRFERLDGSVFVLDNIRLIHKDPSVGPYTYFGGVGFDKTIHGNTGIGTPLEPKLLAYVAMWGKANLKDGNGNILTRDHLVHIMTTSRVRTADLKMITASATDETDHSPDQIETHIIIPPMGVEGNKDPVMGTGQGFLHLMFEKVSLKK